MTDTDCRILALLNRGARTAAGIEARGIANAYLALFALARRGAVRCRVGKRGHWRAVLWTTDEQLRLEGV